MTYATSAISPSTFGCLHDKQFTYANKLFDEDFSFRFWRQCIVVVAWSVSTVCNAEFPEHSGVLRSFNLCSIKFKFFKKKTYANKFSFSYILYSMFILTIK